MTGGEWTTELFDEEYLRVWSFPGPDVTEQEVERLVNLLPSPPARVLDLACGNGRHAIRLAQRGFDVVGIDQTDVFLDLARASAADAGVDVELRRGDMRTAELGRADAVLVLGNSFGYFSEVANEQVLHRIAHALSPGGVLLVELLNRDRIIKNYRSTSNHVAADGTIVELHSTFDPITGINTVQHRWTDLRGGAQRRVSKQRLWTPPELEAICHAEGLEVTAWFDGYSAQRLHLDARRLMLMATKPR